MYRFSSVKQGLFGSDKRPGSKTFYLGLLPQGKKVGEKCEYVFYVYTSKASKRLKMVLLHLWRINVRTTRGFINIPLEEFHIDKTAP